MDDKFAYESYTLILKHELFVGDEKYQIDEPLMIRNMTVMSTGNSNPMTRKEYILNNMFDTLKHEFIRRTVKE